MSTETKKSGSGKPKTASRKSKGTVSGPKGGIKRGTVTILFALIKMSGIGITEISGKLGGNVFSRTKGGAVIRNRVVPTNPQSVAQQSVRAIFGAISSAWRSLTQIERDAWDAITQDYPYQNKLGETKILSGKALFQKLNNNLLYAGEDIKNSPATPEGANAPVSIGNFDVALNAGGTALESWVLDGALADSGDSTSIVVIEATPPLSPGVKNANPRFVRLNQVVAVTGTFDYPSLVDYPNLFGLPDAGTQIQVRVFTVNPVTGEKSAYLKATAIVAQA